MAKRLASFCLIYFIALHGLKAESTVSEQMPGDALIFFESEKISDFLVKVRDSDFFQSLLESGDLDEIKSSDFMKEVSSTFEFLELFLAKDIWTLNERLLNGKMGLGAYESEDPDDPNVVLLIKPEETSKWIKNRIRFAPLLRLGIKRIAKSDFEKEVYAFRTRGDKNDSTYFALSDEWIIVTTSRRLLKDTVSLQGSKVEGAKIINPISKDDKYSNMIKNMGDGHQASLYLNTQEISKIDGRFGIPEKIEDPMLSLFLGGVIDQLSVSSYSGLTLSFDGEELNFSVQVDTAKETVALNQNSPIDIILPPKIPGYLGGISVYQPFSNWYSERNDLFKSKIIPGSDLIKGKLGQLLFGGAKESDSGYLGKSIVFLSAIADDAGKDDNEINLPGFCFLVDLKKVEGVEKKMQTFFEEMLLELKVSDLEGPLEWEKRTEQVQDINLLVASTKKLQEGIAPTPNCFQIGSRFCFSSSYKLSLSLIEKIKNSELTSSESGLNFDLDFNQLTKFFSLNKEEYLAELSRSRGDKKSGERDYNNINTFLSGLKSISGSYDSNEDKLKFNLEARLKKQDKN
ncbi:MAG: hypothetical protein VYC72_05020 [Verrucomicrobiota bacterium]|nr:hypothetical protein [Verrucomicrobiota bacterium]